MDDWRVLPRTGLTVGEVRAKISGLHFARESLTQSEQELLYLAEGLLRLVDEASPPTE